MNTIRIFINERPWSVAPGTSAAEAVRAADRALGEALDAGRAYLTDGRGIQLDPAMPLSAGAIVRVVISARERRPSVSADEAPPSEP